MTSTMRRALQATAAGELVASKPDNGFQKFCPGSDFIGFDGHFPDYPVLPAMLQVLLGIIVSEALYGSPLALQQLDKAKFMSQVQPDQAITVASCFTRALNEESKPAIKARITITTPEQKVASMTILLTET